MSYYVAKEGLVALTRGFVDGMRARAARDPAFPENLLRQGIDRLLAGDVNPGLGILRAYINTTVGFETLARATGVPPKSLQRMFGATGNPRSRNLFPVLHYLQWRAGLVLRVTAQHPTDCGVPGIGPRQ